MILDTFGPVQADDASAIGHAKTWGCIRASFYIFPRVPVRLTSNNKVKLVNRRVKTCIHTKRGPARQTAIKATKRTKAVMMPGIATIINLPWFRPPSPKLLVGIASMAVEE